MIMYSISAPIISIRIKNLRELNHKNGKFFQNSLSIRTRFTSFGDHGAPLFPLNPSVVFWRTRNSKNSQYKTEKTIEKHFVLVHGACLGAWVWYKLVALLKSDGHKVTALDMAASGIHPNRAEDVHSATDYSEPLLEFMAALPPDERVILVGHSMGGICIAVAMEKFPQKIAVAVFLSAVMPCPGINMDSINEKYKRSMDFFMDCKFLFGNGEDKPPTSFLFGPKYSATRLFQLSPPEVIALALLLIRPNPFSVQEKPVLQGLVSKENYGSVCRVYLKAEKDNVINEGIEKFRIENFPPDESKIIHNADHMAMLSNPQELCACLLDISKKYD